MTVDEAFQWCHDNCAAVVFWPRYDWQKAAVSIRIRGNATHRPTFLEAVKAIANGEPERLPE